MTFKIDPHFDRLCPPPSSEELEGLRRSIAAHGCREPLVLWAEAQVLLDGHNRFRICSELGVAFDTVAYSFDSRRDAHNWVIDNQLARRNLSPANVRYLRGARYQLDKADVEDTRKRGAEAAVPGGQIGPPGSTAARIAEQTGVSPRTIKRDARFADVVDQVGDVAGPEARAEILRGEVKIPDRDIELLLETRPKSAEDVRRFAEDRRARRETQLRERRVPNAEAAWGQFNVVDVIPAEDAEGLYVAARKLSCGCTVSAARRVPFIDGKGTKSANCPNCRPGTRTPHERRRTERMIEAAIDRAWRDDELRPLVVELVQSALEAASFGRHPDARAQSLLNRVNALRHKLRLVEDGD